MDFGVQKKLFGVAFVYLLLFCSHATIYSQELTDDWTSSGLDYSTSACGITVSTAISNELNGAFVSFSTDPIGCNMPNTFSNNAVVGQPSLAPFLGYGTTGGSAVLTFNFSEAVTDPVLHIDRLGGGAGNISTSALLTMISPGITVQRLSGNGNHFEVNGNQITRTPDQALTAPPNLECGANDQGVAAGSIQLIGTFTSISFQFEQNGSGGNADAIEVVWEILCTPPNPDFDNDGIPDIDDLDDDNDGILDTIEQNNVPTLDTDSDGLIDSFDLDSDGDGCNDVIEAGFDDPDNNGTLGTAPDDVNANGLIINTTDGYTTPNDLNTNSTFDFQERISIFILQQPMEELVCVGENAEFQVLINNTTTLTWEISEDNGITWNDVSNTLNFSGVNSETLTISSVAFIQNESLFRARIDILGSLCDPEIYSDTVALQVLQTANAGQDATLTLCSNDDPTDLFELLGDSANLGGSWNPSLNSGNNIFDPSLDLEGSYTYTVGSGNCQDSAEITVSVAPFPEITAVNISNNENIIQVDISVINPDETEFSIDGTNFQNNNVFDGLTAGEYTIYARSLNGCGTATDTIEINGIFDYPKFFTPNQDGINDTWQISQMQLPNSQTYIYDRYGKLLIILVGENDYWDGTYRNKRMPSTDYWFKAISDQEVILKGHFSLKR